VRDASTRSAEAKQFLSELYARAPREWIAEITLLQYRPTPEHPDAKRAESLVFHLDELERDWDGEIFPQLDRFNAKFAANIHHGVNPRSRRPASGFGKNEDVEAYVSLWVDIDFRGNEEAIRKKFTEAVELLRAAGIPPSCIVDSGHGLHAYWLLDEPYPVAEARPCCAGVMDFFKISDPIHDPRRLLRVPGFLNVKDPQSPRECRIVEATWARYPLSAFKDYAIDLVKRAPVIAAQAPSPEAGQEAPAPAVKTVSRDPRIEEVKKGVAEGGGPYGGRHNAAVALAGHYCAHRRLSKNVILREMLSWNAKNTPPLPEKEIVEIVEDIWAKEQVHRAEEENKKTAAAPWFADGKWHPLELVRELMRREKYIATPIGKDGKGVTIYRYEDGVFVPDGISVVVDEILDILDSKTQDNYIDDVVSILRATAKVPYEEVNNHSPELINVKNGMLNWRTGELLPHDPKYLSLTQIPVPWEPGAKSEKLDSFLNAVLPPDSLSLVEEFVGYLLIPDIARAKALVLVGEGGNGKTTFLSLVESLIGKENISNLSLHALVEDRFTAAGLFAKLANFYDELETRALENTASFKQLVNGGAIKAEEKFLPPFSYRPYARFVFATNQMPRATDKSQAYFDRLIFVEFRNRFRGTAAEVPDYARVLAETPGVLPALLVRAVAGLRRLMERGRFELPESSLGALEEYRRECNSGYDFIREHCERAEAGWIAKAELYEHYKNWCETNGRKALSSREFNRIVQQTFDVKEVRHDNVRFWDGICWRDNGEPPRIGIEERERFGNGNERLSLDF
jgi:P4 family phage/plasmid primase-like protien